VPAKNPSPCKAEPALAAWLPKFIPSMSKHSKNPKGLSGKAIFKIFVTYFILCIMLASLALLGMKNLIGSTGTILLAVGSILIPVLATYAHVLKGKKNAVSDIAKRMP
jgi:hypothetical protein